MINCFPTRRVNSVLDRDLPLGNVQIDASVVDLDVKTGQSYGVYSYPMFRYDLLMSHYRIPGHQLELAKPAPYWRLLCHSFAINS